MRNICGIIDWKKERSPTWYWLLFDQFIFGDSCERSPKSNGVLLLGFAIG